MAVTLIFKHGEHPKKGVAIRRVREGEDGMPTLIVPFDGIEKAELDYIMEANTESEKERIEKGKPIIERRLEDQGNFDEEVRRGKKTRFVKPDEER